ncbi:hypothetical protein BH20ACT18_BH20ACT18_02750 [soil metagenome]
MRTTRAFIAGLGTTGSLLAATACAFLLTSALVAFNGWPGGGIGDDVNSLFVDDEPVTVASAGPEGVAADSTEAAAFVLSVPGDHGGGGGGHVPGAASSGVHPGTSGGTGIVQVAPGGGPTPPAGGGGSGPAVDDGLGGSPFGGAGPRPSPPQSAEARSPTIGTSIADTTGQLGDTVSSTTNQVGAAVGGPVGDVVTSIGQAVDDLVTGIGQQVGGTFGPK